ncbi:MAG: prolipoprotein diacylglyceryl transferase [Deltaproteobacteria bacterium]|nr:prolipoprotein diacylglyceryl transferase [Deltaproteobacteria bacterium]
MYPTLFSIGDFSVSSHTAMMVVAFLLAYVLSLSEFKRKGISESLCDLFFIASIIGGIGGAKILFLYQNATLSDFISDPLTYLASGITFYGGLIGGIILFILTAKWKKVSFWLISDAATPGLILAYAVGRIGCFLVGDDYGTPTSLPWAISFPNGAPPTTDRVHPTQLYDTLLMFIAFAFIWKIRKKKLPTGSIFAITLIILGVERFFIEFIRNTSPSFIPGLSQAQLISIGIIIVAIYKLIQVKIQTVKSSEVQA